MTRRCAQRQLLLRPSPVTSQIFLYSLAVAAKRRNILLTDPDAQLPEFGRDLAALVARAMNAKLDRWEAFWAPGSYSAVALTTPEDIVAKAAYTLANPVEAGLVERGSDWPGLWSAPDRIGGAAFTVERPEVFFRKQSYMPAATELELAVPPGFASAEEFRDRVAAALATAEEQARAKIAAEGRKFIGKARVLAQSTSARPRAPEPRRGLNPRVASRDKWKRIEALLELTEFRAAYREAWKELRAGKRDVVFPAGTYLLRVVHGVRCAAYS